MNFYVYQAPKPNDRQADNRAVTGGTVSCRNESSRHHQRRQSYQIDDPLLAVKKDKEYNTFMIAKLFKHNEINKQKYLHIYILVM